MWVWLGFLGFFWVFFTTEKNFVGLRFLTMLTFFPHVFYKKELVHGLEILNLRNHPWMFKILPQRTCQQQVGQQQLHRPICSCSRPVCTPEAREQERQ